MKRTALAAITLATAVVFGADGPAPAGAETAIRLAQATPAQKPATPAAKPAATPAQPPKPAAPVTADGWLKTCGVEATQKKTICRTGVDIRTEAGALLASAVLNEVQGEKKPQLLFQLPFGLLLRENVKLKIDEGDETEAKFIFCMNALCMAMILPDPAFVERMKAGKALIATAVRETGDKVSYSFPLATFKAAYDGGAAAADALKERDEQIRERAATKAQTLQEMLLEAQKKAREGQ